jgi:hypothetical protein
MYATLIRTLGILTNFIQALIIYNTIIKTVLGIPFGTV